MSPLWSPERFGLWAYGNHYRSGDAPVIRDPIITRWQESSDRHPGFMAIKLSKTKELCIAEYSERAQDKLIQSFNEREERRRRDERERRALKRKAELIEGEAGDGQAI